MAEDTFKGGGIDFQFVENAKTAEASIGNINSYLNTVNNSASAFSAAMAQLVDLFGKLQKLTEDMDSTDKERLKTEKGMEISVESLSKKQKKIAESLAKQLDLKKQFVKVGGQEITMGKVTEAEAKKKEVHFKRIKQEIKEQLGSLKGQLTSMVGFNLSLGSVFALLLKVYNQMRMVHGMSMQAAAQMGGGAKNAGMMKDSIFQLRGAFAMTYEEAGAVVNQLAKMGFSAKDITGEHYKRATLILPLEHKHLEKSNALAKLKGVQIRAANDYETSAATYAAKREYSNMARQRVYASNARALAEMVQKGLNETYEQEKVASSELHKQEVTDAKAAFEKIEAARRKNFQETLGMAKELTAVQKKYGVELATSGGFVKKMELDFNKLNIEGRNMLGAAIKLGEEIDHLAPEDMINDWNTLIDQAKTYKTDVLGILALYKSMMRDEAAMGLKGVPYSVKKSIAETVSGWKATLALGLKAKLGKARGGEEGPAARALEFEEAGYGEQLTRFINFAKTQVDANNKAGSVVKIRQLAEMFQFPPDVQKHIADMVVSGQASEEEVSKFTVEQKKQRESIEASEKAWSEGRGSLVTSASDIARSTQDIQKLIQQAVENFLAQYMDPIVNILKAIWELVGGAIEFWRGGKGAMGAGKEAAANVIKEAAVREARKNLSTPASAGLEASAAKEKAIIDHITGKDAAKAEKFAEALSSEFGYRLRAELRDANTKMVMSLFNDFLSGKKPPIRANGVPGATPSGGGAGPGSKVVAPTPK